MREKNFFTFSQHSGSAYDVLTLENEADKLPLSVTSGTMIQSGLLKRHMRLLSVYYDCQVSGNSRLIFEGNI